MMSTDPHDTQLANLGGGCFRCTETVFLDVDGVRHVESGYRNGHVLAPTYEQARSANEVMAELSASGAVRGRIVTELVPEANDSAAEAYHQNYFAQHPGWGYCAFAVAPELDKCRQIFARHRRR